MRTTDTLADNDFVIKSRITSQESVFIVFLRKFNYIWPHSNLETRLDFILSGFNQILYFKIHI